MGVLLDTVHHQRLRTLGEMRAFLHALEGEDSFLVEGWEPTCERHVDLVVSAAQREGDDQIDLADGTYDRAVAGDLLRLVTGRASYVWLRSECLNLRSWPDKANVCGPPAADGAPIELTTAHRGAALGRFLEAMPSSHLAVHVAGPDPTALEVVPRLCRALRAKASASLVLGADACVALAEQVRPLDIVVRTDLADVRWPGGELVTYLVLNDRYAAYEAAWGARVEAVMERAGISR
jgi:hypothetical protein